MKNGSLTTRWPLLAVAGIQLLFCIAIIGRTVHILGRMVYALDDPYIHLTIARNLALHGVWGMSPNTFDSADSSLLWPIILAAVYRVTAHADMLPLVLNAAFAMLLLLIFDQMLQGRIRSLPRFALLLLFSFCAGFPIVLAEGMEHVLQAVLSLLYLIAASRTLLGESPAAERWRRAMLVLTPILTMTRYEEGFLIMPVILALLIRRRRRDAAAVAILAALPVAVFGAVSVAQHSFPIPNSILLKTGALQSPASAAVPVAAQVGIVTRLHDLAIMSPPVLWKTLSPWIFEPYHLCIAALTPALLASIWIIAGRLRSSGTLFEPGVLECALFFAAAVLQLALLPDIYRYVYHLAILFCGVIAALASGTAGPRVPIRVVATAVCITPFVLWSVSRSLKTPTDIRNIYDQQIQMSRFLQRYYSGAAIGVNDIGAVSYYGGVTSLDLYGLASIEVARAKRTGAYSSVFIASLAQKNRVPIAVIYPSWFNEYGGLPPGWIPVGEWRIPDNDVCGDSSVVWFATSHNTASALAAALRDFAGALPPEDELLGPYVHRPFSHEVANDLAPAKRAPAARSPGVA